MYFPLESWIKIIFFPLSRSLTIMLFTKKKQCFCASGTSGKTLRSKSVLQFHLRKKKKTCSMNKQQQTWSHGTPSLQWRQVQDCEDCPKNIDLVREEWPWTWNELEQMALQGFVAYIIFCCTSTYPKRLFLQWFILENYFTKALYP